MISIFKYCLFHIELLPVYFFSMVNVLKPKTQNPKRIQLKPARGTSGAFGPAHRYDGMQPFFPQKGNKTTPEHKPLYISR